MKRATVFHYYSRYLVHPSGVTDSLNAWVRALSEAGMPTQILCALPGGGVGNEFADRARTHAIPHLGWSRSTWAPISLARRIHKGDVLVLHEGWVLSNFVAAAIARAKRVPYVVVPHGVYESGIADAVRDIGFLRRGIERWVLRNAAAVHVFYDGEKSVIKAIEPAVKRFVVHPNGAPESDDRWRGAGDYFLWIGRFDPYHKGLDNLVRAWELLAEPRPRLVLAGPDFMNGRQTVAQTIADKGLEDVISVRGRVSGEEKMSLMRDARAYVHPSRWESCSIMLLEMLAMGVPAVVSSSIHAADELEPDGVVLSVDFVADSETIRSAVDRVDRNAELSEHAIEWVRLRGSWNAVSPPYARDIAELAASGGQF